jgi:hypothetical protein
MDLVEMPLDRAPEEEEDMLLGKEKRRGEKCTRVWWILKQS